LEHALKNIEIITKEEHMVFTWIVFGLGIVGGLLAEALKWYQLRESSSPPVYFKSPLYWVVTLLMALSGGVLAVVNNGGSTSPLLALNIGISAPLILKGIATVTPVKPPDTAGRSFEAKKSGGSVLDIMAGR
jgi:hypothetical protein